MRDIGNLHSTRDKLAGQLDLRSGEERGGGLKAFSVWHDIYGNGEIVWAERLVVYCTYAGRGEGCDSSICM